MIIVSIYNKQYNFLKRLIHFVYFSSMYLLGSKSPIYMTCTYLAKSEGHQLAYCMSQSRKCSEMTARTAQREGIAYK